MSGLATTLLCGIFALCRVALAMLAFYRSALSPLMQSTCRYQPTCSNYSIESYKKFGTYAVTLTRTLTGHAHENTQTARTFPGMCSQRGGAYTAGIAHARPRQAMSACHVLCLMSGMCVSCVAQVYGKAAFSPHGGYCAAIPGARVATTRLCGLLLAWPLSTAQRPGSTIHT